MKIGIKTLPLFGDYRIDNSHNPEVKIELPEEDIQEFKSAVKRYTSWQKKIAKLIWKDSVQDRPSGGDV